MKIALENAELLSGVCKKITCNFLNYPCKILETNNRFNLPSSSYCELSLCCFSLYARWGGRLYKKRLIENLEKLTFSVPKRTWYVWIQTLIWWKYFVPEPLPNGKKKTTLKTAFFFLFVVCVWRGTTVLLLIVNLKSCYWKNYNSKRIWELTCEFLTSVGIF